MSNGVICKVWNIHGDTFMKKASVQLSDSMEYILNEEKTDYKIPMEESVINDTMAQLQRECQYVENDIKTLDGTYVGTQNLISDDAGGAVREMMQVKEFYGKLDGRAALHGIISLPAWESGKERISDLMKMCSEILKEVFPDNQAVFAVHTNTDNLHIHFIVNSVGLNGKKIHQNNSFIASVLQPCVNKYARKYGFTPNDKWEKPKEETNKKTSYGDLKIRMRNLIDTAIENSEDFEGFLSELRADKVTVNIGKYISLKTDEMSKAIRTYNLGANYTKDAIIERIKTKYDALQGPEVHQFTMGQMGENIFTPQIKVMKPYKDMPPDEKKYVIKELKLGRNPWRTSQALNWQLDNIARELNSNARITELVKFYSGDGTLEGALEGILEAKKNLSAEKKLLRAQMKRYKPITDIYNEMKSIAKKAYLYDIEGIKEYRPEFEKYRELAKRLERGYGKNILEVGSFLGECQERLIYAQAQLDELSGEYKEVKRYGMEHGEIKKRRKSLYDISDIHETLQDIKKGMFGTGISYVVSKESEYMLQIYKFAELSEKGKLEEKIEMAVMNRYGEVLEKFTGQVNKEIKKSIYDIENKYSFHTCERYTSITKARDYLDAKVNKNNKAGTRLRKEKLYSFTQAVNFNSAKDKCGIHVIVDVNVNVPKYMAVIVTKEETIMIQVVDRTGEIQKEIEIPAFRERNKQGMKELIQIQKEFGFSDEIVSYENIEEARERTDKVQRESVRSGNRAERRQR